MPQPSIMKISLKIVYLKFHQNLPDANELTPPSASAIDIWDPNSITTMSENGLASNAAKPWAGAQPTTKYHFLCLFFAVNDLEFDSFKWPPDIIKNGR